MLYYRSEFGQRPKDAREAAEAAGETVRRPLEDVAYAVYCHIPFCATRCTYCDFFTTSRLTSLRQPYADALVEEARQVAEAAGEPFSLGSLYLGGGTPSFLPGEVLKTLISRLRGLFRWQEGVEVTVEANPGDVSEAWLRSIREAGVNRLSLGMQAADEAVLALLGRRHGHEDTRHAVERARRVGFGNLNLDLIYGVPGQTMDTWRKAVEEALRLQPEHLSAYCLSLERRTPMEEWVRRGLLQPPDDDLAAEQYEWLEGRLLEAGYVHYEISNWALGPLGADGQPRFACRHNLPYWQNRPYLGLGAGAHGCAAGVRYAVVRSVSGYIERVKNPGKGAPFPLTSAVGWLRRVSAEEAAADSLLLGLRLTAAGVEVEAFVKRHGERAWRKHRPTLDRLAEEGLIEWVDDSKRVRLSPRGRLLGNRVFREFV